MAHHPGYFETTVNVGTVRKGENNCDRVFLDFISFCFCFVVSVFIFFVKGLAYVAGGSSRDGKVSARGRSCHEGRRIFDNEQRK